jgi:hypothetical protein
MVEPLLALPSIIDFLGTWRSNRTPTITAANSEADWIYRCEQARIFRTFPKEAQQSGLIAAHDDAHVRSANEGLALSINLGRRGDAGQGRLRCLSRAGYAIVIISNMSRGMPVWFADEGLRPTFIVIRRNCHERQFLHPLKLLAGQTNSRSVAMTRSPFGGMCSPRLQLGTVMRMRTAIQPTLERLPSPAPG